MATSHDGGDGSDTLHISARHGDGGQRAVSDQQHMTHGKPQVISRTASRQKTEAEATFVMMNERLQK
eukprot:5260352-Prorocentrum_lima.AAC.1